MNIIKKSISIMSIVLILLCTTIILPISVNAVTSENYQYTILDNGTVEITMCYTASGDFRIPLTIDGYTVTQIGWDAFGGCKNLTSLSMPDTITMISDSAFCACPNLKSITIPSSVKKIGQWAFSGDENLTRINISDFDAWYSISFGNNLFECAHDIYLNGEILSDIVIPDTSMSINRGAFEKWTSLKSISIPAHVRDIGTAFLDCIELSNIMVDPNNRIYDCRNDCNAIIETKSNALKLGTVNTIIPDSVTSIDYGAFYGKIGLKSITIPDSVKSIGSKAFFDCKGLTNIDIGDSVTSINESAFKGCIGLKSINIPDSVLSIGPKAFSNCTSLLNVCFGESVAIICQSAFNGCLSLESIAIPNSVTSIGEEAFYNCPNMKSVVIPSSVNEICEKAFGYYNENDDDNEKRLEGFTIRCYEDSQAYDYAWNNFIDIIKIELKKDNATGIAFEIPDNRDFSVNVLSEQQLTESAKDILQNYNVKAAYSITIINNDSTLKALSGIMVCIPCNNNVKIFRKEADGSITNINAIYMNGYMKFYHKDSKIYYLAEIVTDNVVSPTYNVVSPTYNVVSYPYNISSYETIKRTNTVKIKSNIVKARANKKTIIKKSKAFTIKNAVGKVTFKKLSGNKKITINKSGKITVKKGLKKGKTFKLKVKISAAGNAQYSSKSKTVTVKIKIK